MKRLLQYSQSKKTKQLRAISPTHLPPTLTLSTLLISSLYTRAYCIYHALGYACSYLVSRSSSLLLLLGMSVSLMPYASWLTCILYMYSLHLVSTTYTLPYCTCILLISCFVAPCTYFISYITLLFCTCTAYF